MVRGGELIQSTAPDNASEVPGFIFANPPDTTPEDCVELSADFNVGWSRSTRPCSSEAVLESETRVKKPVSRPKAIATTEISTATPRPRLIHWRALHGSKHATTNCKSKRQRRSCS